MTGEKHKKLLCQWTRAVDGLPGLELDHIHRQRLINGNLIYTDAETADIYPEAEGTLARIYCGGQFIGIVVVKPAKTA